MKGKKAEAKAEAVVPQQKVCVNCGTKGIPDQPGEYWTCPRCRANRVKRGLKPNVVPSGSVQKKAVAPAVAPAVEPAPVAEAPKKKGNIVVNTAKNIVDIPVKIVDAVIVNPVDKVIVKPMDVVVAKPIKKLRIKKKAKKEAKKALKQ